MKKVLMPAAAIAGVATVLLAPFSVQAATFTPADLDQLTLGAKIVGPVGPEVETSLINSSGEGLGDLSSSVSCPAGFASCVPPENPAGTVYTYIHEVTPGVDFPNDPPFAEPDTVLPVTAAQSFSLDFPASGFNGVAGYSFSEAEAALGTDNAPTVEETEGGGLTWRIPTLAEWSDNEKISFFWQTSQNPSGPGGTYRLGTSDQSGTGAGPLPTPVAVESVPEPGAIAPLTLLGLGLLLKRRFKN